MSILLPNMLLYNEDNIEILGAKQYSDDFINRLANTFDKKKNSVLKFFNIDSISKVRLNLFDDRQKLITYLKNFFDVSNYCVGAVCNGEICYYINDEYLTDLAKSRLYDSVNYS